MEKISIIIPAFNEEGAIGPVLQAIKALPLDAEIIIVDDGSTDRTAEIAAENGVRVVRHPMNVGYGYSVKDGIRAATNDVIVLSDADGTYPIDRIPDLVTELNRGFHMVVGARQGRAYHGSFLKKFARIVFKMIAEFMTGNRIPDVNSGFRALRKSEVGPYLHDLCNGFSFTTTITLVYMFTGKMVGYMPIAYEVRVGRSKVRIVRDTFRTLQYIIETSVHYNPPKIFLMLALITFLWSMFLWIWLGLASLLFGGIGAALVFAIGLVAEGLRKTPK
ncbi:glycosyltransferase family 2 protein [Candidatus Peregrinibacteria bacterium]|nr:glycosyltransferase family 2 protein [Candidatus Peregrinibacteria bacterium]